MALGDSFRSFLRRRPTEVPAPASEPASAPSEPAAEATPPALEAVAPPPYDPAELASRWQTLELEMVELRKKKVDTLTQLDPNLPAERKAVVEAELDKAINAVFDRYYNENRHHLPEVLKRVSAKEALSQQELHLIADDLVRQGLEASVVDEKLASMTGQKNIRELIKSRELLPRDIESLNLAPEQKTAIREWWERSGWLKKAFGKSAATGAIGLTIGVLSGGVAPTVFFAGLAGTTAGNLAVEKWRSVAERKLKKQEVQSLVNDGLAAHQAAQKVVELRRQGVEDQVALNQGVVSLVEALQNTSGEALEARKQLSDFRHNVKWALYGLAGSAGGAALGVGALSIWEVLHGGFRAGATEAAMETVKQTGETFKVRNHDVRFVHDAWRWLLGESDPQGVLRAVNPSGELIEKATTGMAHYSELWAKGAGVTAELAARVQEQVHARVMAQFYRTSAALLGGLIFGEGAASIWRGIANARQAGRVETGAKQTEAAFAKTLEAAAAAKTKAAERAEAARAAEESKPKLGDLFYVPENFTFTIGDQSFSYEGRLEVLGQNEAGNFRVRLVDNLDTETLPTTEITLNAEQINGFGRGPYSPDQKTSGFSTEGYAGVDQRYKPNLDKLAQPGVHFLIFFKDANLPTSLKKAIAANPEVKIRAVSPPDFKRNEIDLEDEAGQRYHVRMTLIMRWLQSVSATGVAAVGTPETVPTAPAAAASTEARPAAP